MSICDCEIQRPTFAFPQTQSGGQKARLALCRAVYSRAACILLDDTLSAVDTICSSHIVKECFGGALVKDRTVVLVSHHRAQCLSIATQAILMDKDGSILRVGPPSVIGDLVLQQEEVSDAGAQYVVTDIIQDAMPFSPTAQEHDQVRRKIYSDEVREIGHVKTNVYAFFFRCAGKWYYHLALLSLYLAIRGGEVSQSLVIERWTAPVREKSSDWYISLYASIIGAGVILEIAKWLLLYGFGDVGFSCGIGRKVHFIMLDRVSGASLRFFDRVPVGRLVGRFASDISELDSQISDAISRLLSAGKPDYL